MHTSLACGKWSTIGCLSHHVQLFVDDVIKITFFDAQSELSSFSFDYKITLPSQGDPHNWPRIVADYINMHIPLVNAGKIINGGLVVAYKGNKIFSLKSSGICKARVEFYCAAKLDKDDVISQSEYDYIFPEQCQSYHVGTKVLQPKTGDIYQCRAWPFNELCRTANKKDSLFEPGLGESWPMAWIKVKH